MSGFRKAKAEQAALKLGIYGLAGSGKTFTSLLIAEGLAALDGRRVALVDTEHGSDFYAQAVPGRKVHPAAFEFDALYTRSITDIDQAVRSLKATDYGVIVIDSMTHVWESAIGAYKGRQTSVGTIPMHAWGAIKKPYKALIAFLLSSPLHVVICGRQGFEYGQVDDGEDLKVVGTKMKAEGETAYEPHILLRLEAVKQGKTKEAIITAFAEKDRTGVLAGNTFQWPTFDAICKPLLPLLGQTQAQIQTEEEVSSHDAAAMADAERAKGQESEDLLREWSAKVDLCRDAAALKALGKALTPKEKGRMLPVHVTALRERYQAAERKLLGQSTYEPIGQEG